MGSSRDGRAFEGAGRSWPAGLGLAGLGLAGLGSVGLVMVCLGVGGAQAQTIQQTITSSSGTETLPFNPTAPASDLNTVSDPVVRAAYTDPASQAATTVFSGGQVIANFASSPGSQAVTVTIPTLGLTQTFTGGTRAENFGQAVLFAEQKAPGLFVVGTPVSSPLNRSNVAVGNPLSLVPQMVSRTFRVDSGIGQFEPNLPTTSGLTRTPSAITAGGEITYGSTAGLGILAITVPIGYKYYLEDPRYSITVDIPLTFLRVGSASVGLGSAGATFKFPVVGNWSLGVGTRVGAVGSEQLQVGATAYSTTLSSEYKWYLGDYKVTLGNSLSYLKTSGFRVGHGESGPSLTNVPVSNGVSLEGSLPFTMFDKPASYEAYVVDTYFLGQRLATQHYDEIGFNFGTRSPGGDQSWNNARFGVAYTVGRSFNAGSLRFSYRF